MPFDKTLLALTIATALSGCATVAELKEKVMPSTPAATAASAPTTGTTAASTAAPAPAAAPKPAVVNDTPVNPAAQRAYDDANRALRAGRTADAERAYVALTKSNPELGGPHANLGAMYRKAGKPEASVKELEQAVALSPSQPVYLNQLGISYRQLGQFDKARGAYERAIAADPAYAAPVLNLGILNDLYLNDAVRAADLYDRYLTLAPGGDAIVTKWVAELKNRKGGPVTLLSKKEKT